jgi:hypothetical protein
MYINMYWCFDISINIYTCICTYSNIHNMTVPIVTEAPRFDRAAGALLRSQMQHVTMSHGLHLQGLKAGSVTYTSCACTYAYAFLCLQIHVTCMHVFFPLSLSLFFSLCYVYIDLAGLWHGLVRKCGFNHKIAKFQGEEDSRRTVGCLIKQSHRLWM